MPAAARIVRIRHDWPPGSNQRLLAEREARLARHSAALKAEAEARAAATPRAFRPRPTTPEGRILAELQRCAEAGQPLPSFRALSATLGWSADDVMYVRAALELMEKRGLLRLFFGRTDGSTLDAIRLADGRTLIRPGADIKEPA